MTLNARVTESCRLSRECRSVTLAKRSVRLLYHGARSLCVSIEPKFAYLADRYQDLKARSGDWLAVSPKFARTIMPPVVLKSFWPLPLSNRTGKVTTATIVLKLSRCCRLVDPCTRNAANWIDEVVTFNGHGWRPIHKLERYKGDVISLSCAPLQAGA